MEPVERNPDSWKVRVAKEYEDLKEKIEKLARFLYGDASALVPPKEKNRLNKQLLVMEMYGEILKERLGE